MRLRRRRNAPRSRAADRAEGPPREPIPSASGPLAVAQRWVTPARALAVVAVAAAVCLGGSQFSDYRAVEVGAPEYRGVESLAQPPELDRRSPRSAHGSYVIAIAIAALAVTALAVARNWRLARLLAILGAAVVVISLVVDAQEGLREGTAGVAYQGANAILLGGFWAQLSSGVTLMVVGPILALQLRDERGPRRAGRRSRRSDVSGSLAGTPPGSGAERAAT